MRSIVVNDMAGRFSLPDKTDLSVSGNSGAYRAYINPSEARFKEYSGTGFHGCAGGVDIVDQQDVRAGRWKIPIVRVHGKGILQIVKPGLRRKIFLGGRVGISEKQVVTIRNLSQG